MCFKLLSVILAFLKQMSNSQKDRTDSKFTTLLGSYYSQRINFIICEKRIYHKREPAHCISDLLLRRTDFNLNLLHLFSQGLQFSVTKAP